MFEFERATSVPALWNAWQKVSGKNSASYGIDDISLDYYRSNARENIDTLHYSLITDSYTPYRERSFQSKKNRTIYISCIEDKIVQSAIARVLYEDSTFSNSVHGFILKRSIFTAHKKLKISLQRNVTTYFKTDISKFYESVDNLEMLRIIAKIAGEGRFTNLVKKMLDIHGSGLSTGSALSPVLSNLYLADFDANRRINTCFYSRYVDDMLLAPLPGASMDDLIRGTSEELKKIGLCLNEAKSSVVDACEGFRYLGFDIRVRQKQMEEYIAQGDFGAAEKLMNMSENEAIEELSSKPILDAASEKKNQNVCVIAEPLGFPEIREADEKILAEADSEDIPEPEPEEESPDFGVNPEKVEVEGIGVHVLGISKKCHVIRQMVDHAKKSHYLGFPEKQSLLHIFHCLGEEGAKYLHWVMSHCDDYDYGITQGYIDRCKGLAPLGCKKLCDRFEDFCDKSKCNCNFTQEKMYPSPVIHALRRKPGCVNLPQKENHIGHFKQTTARQGAEDALSRLLALNKQEYEIKTQKRICNGQLESLFTRNDIKEIETPQGLLIKAEDGFYIKLG
jgi:hypothetical protein